MPVGRWGDLRMLENEMYNVRFHPGDRDCIDYILQRGSFQEMLPRKLTAGTQKWRLGSNDFPFQER